MKVKEFKKLFQDAIAEEKQEEVFENFIRPLCEKIIKKRVSIQEPTPADLVRFAESFSASVLALPAS